MLATATNIGLLSRIPKSHHLVTLFEPSIEFCYDSIEVILRSPNAQVASASRHDKIVGNCSYEPVETRLLLRSKIDRHSVTPHAWTRIPEKMNRNTHSVIFDLTTTTS